MLISGGKLVTSKGIKNNPGVLVIGGMIEKVGAREVFNGEWLNASGMYIAPGFIDLHVHGGGGADVMDGTTESVVEVARFHARNGTTALLATTAASTPDVLIRSLEAISSASRMWTGGAQVLGAHLEGPMINHLSRGAQPREHIRHLSVEETRDLLDRSGGAVKIVTLAPELPGAEDVIQLLRERGIVPAAGHSLASYEDSLRAFAWGVCHATHTFNGMGPWHHRGPGLIGAVLVQPGITAEIIADGYHVHPGTLRLLVQAKGPEEIVLVTDAIRAAGLPDGEYSFAGMPVRVIARQARLTGGQLAGSTLTMAEAVKNMVALGVPLYQAVAMASVNPARVLGLEGRKGSIEPGKEADLVILDRSLSPRRVIVGGKVVN
ncbi:MAG: N-acetylglucosamine-6-phosphate deacetylase [Bacillota bacterium]